MSTWLLNTSKERDSTAFLGTLCQCLVTLTVEKCFLMLRGNFQCFSLCPWSLVLSLGINKKSLALSSFYAPFRYLHTWMRLPLSSILHHAILQQAPVHKNKGLKYRHSESMQHRERLMHAYIASSNIFSWNLRNLALNKFQLFLKNCFFLYILTIKQ